MTVFSEKEKIKIIKIHHKNFQEARLKRIKRTTLNEILKKNPYLYASRDIQTSEQLINSMLTDLITSSDETIFGDKFFEPLGLEISRGVVSVGKGTDFSVITDSEIHVYSFKSGINIQNASATEKQGQEFTETSQRLRKTKKSIDNVRIHGYGKTSSEEKAKTPFRKISGQAAWEELSGCPDFFTLMSDVISKESEKYRSMYKKEYDEKASELIKQFDLNFPSRDGKIDWKTFTEFNSGKEFKGKRLKTKK